MIREVGKLESMSKKFKREISIWTNASHLNIHSFYGIRGDDNFGLYGALISPNGDLQQYLDERKGIPLEDHFKLWR